LLIADCREHSGDLEGREMCSKKTDAVDYKALLATEIGKTGYVLEHEVAQALKVKGWTVISGKYYVDDSEEVPREMDLIAYRVARFDNDEVEMYTALIISCKKSDENAWALLARDINLKDPNTDYWPLHAWSNDPALTHQLSRPGKAKMYHEGVRQLGVDAAVADPKVEVFAFQEMSKASGAPKNDKAIFAALTSLVKAQAYEISSLAGRKKARAVYQFNLISVLGSDLYRLMFAKTGTGIACDAIESEQYIARYIVSKRESFSRVRFLTSSSFAAALDDYGRLHAANAKWFAAEHSSFYAGILEDPTRTRALEKKFYDKLRHVVKNKVERRFKDLESFDEEPWLSWSAKRSLLMVGYFESDQVLEFMNESTEIRSVVASALKDVYRYAGPFEFSLDIPF
jgi:hypothetical protein